MNPVTVLVRPLLSEKSNDQREHLNKYCFMVNPSATKVSGAAKRAVMTRGDRVTR